MITRIRGGHEGDGGCCQLEQGDWRPASGEDSDVKIKLKVNSIASKNVSTCQ